MEEIKIAKANAWKAFDGATTDGKKLLTDLFGSEVFSRKITDRVKSFEDACLVLNLDAAKEIPAGLPAHVEAYMKLCVIAKALNEGWTPDWDNGNQYKYYPYFDMKNGFSFFSSYDYCQYSRVGSRLCFQNSKLAEYAGTQFLDLYKQLFIL